MFNSISSKGEIYTSATEGILVDRGLQQHLTCSFHNWQDRHHKYPHLFGQSSAESQLKFQVLQGNPGTKVGSVRERMGKTDIALAQLNDGVVFENKFMEMECSVKVLVRSDDAGFADEYMIDFFTAVKQKLRGNGRRFLIKREPGQSHGHFRAVAGRDHPLPSDEAAYIELMQGAYITNNPAIQCNPYIREGVRGAVLLRCKDGRNPGMAQSDVMARGQIFAMMRGFDSRTLRTSEAASYICYAGSFDPLISGGWKVVERSEKERSEEKAESDAEIGAPPAKNQQKGKSLDETETESSKQQKGKGLDETETESSKQPGKRGGAGSGGRRTKGPCPPPRFAVLTKRYLCTTCK